MKIRYLRRKSGQTVVSVWPPLWASADKPGDTFAIGEVGVLVSVKRLDDRLSLTMKFEGGEHVGSLQWDAPSSLDDVEKVLRAHLGHPIKAISELDA